MASSEAFPILIFNDMESVCKCVYVVCEGKSEKAYLQELNKILSERGITLSFVIETAGNGHFCHLKATWMRLCKRARKPACKDDFCFWADWDLFHRNYKKCLDLYNKEKEKLPSFFFNYHNFEDFISLQLSEDKSLSWCITCNGKGHFREPLYSEEYEPLFISLVPGYKKGKLPIELDVVEGVKRLKERAGDRRFLQKSEFADFLLKELEPFWSEFSR